MENKDTASAFLERHSTSEGKIHVQSALLELWARQKNIQEMLQEIREGIGGYAAYMEKMDERLTKLEPTIQIVSEAEANKILGKK